MALYAVTIALAGMILAPVIIVVLGSCVNASLLGVSTEKWSGQSAVFNFDSFGYILKHYFSWIVFSLELAVLSVTLCLLVAIPAAYAFVRYPFPGSRMLEETVMLPLALPGITLSIGLLAAYNSMRGPWLVLTGHLLYTMPFMVRIVTSTLRSFNFIEMEMAAESLGARFWQRLFSIILPSLRHAMIVAALLIFSISWGEFNVSFLLNTGKPQTFPAALFDTFTNESFQTSGAATTIFLAVVLPVVIAIQWLGSAPAEVERGA